jgi:glucan phosphoethanolaminetransferase (alkaline phosphatase superfamily)
MHIFTLLLSSIHYKMVEFLINLKAGILRAFFSTGKKNSKTLFKTVVNIL